MESIELHIITNGVDAEQAFIAGLLDEPFYTDVCANCGDDVGAFAEFEPFVFVLGADDLGYSVCTYCALPITDPGEDDDESIDALEAQGFELDTFELLDLDEDDD